MKFSHTLSLNANPDWADQYIDYAGLKKVINELENSSSSADEEDGKKHRRDVFLAKLRKMMTMVRQFYDRKRAELDSELDRLREKLEVEEELKKRSREQLTDLDWTTDSNQQERKQNERESNSSNDHSTEESPLLSDEFTFTYEAPIHPMEPSSQQQEQEKQQQQDQKQHIGNTKKSGGMLKSLSSISLNGLEDSRVEICDLFTQYHNLKMYASLNGTAVRKILKKYDKVLDDNLKDDPSVQNLIQQILPAYETYNDDKEQEPATPQIDKSLQILQQYFAHFYCDDNREEAQRRLRYMIREFVSYQRHSVWLDVIQDQRRQQSAFVTMPPSFMAPFETTTTATKPTIPSATTRAKQPAWQQRILLFLMRNLGACISIGLFVTLLIVPGIFDADPTKRNALALFVFVSILWATEAFPLFVTAMLVPFFTVVLRVIVIDGHRLDACAASKHAFASMFSHVIMLLLGGFSMAAALSKHNIAQTVSSSIARRCGSGTRTAVAVHLFLSTFVSMWISNVAAPVLMYSLINPILKAATAGTSRSAFGKTQQVAAERDHRLCRALILGIALASNVGGMASPISSPQNLFAIEYAAAEHPIGWIQWFVVSIPLCTVLDAMIWAWLCFCFDLPPDTESVAVAHAIGYSHGHNNSSNRHHQYNFLSFTGTQYFVIAVSVGVLLLWCASNNMESLTGQMGVLGIVPLAVFFGTGILAKEDLNSFPWNVVILAMGGLVLGEAVKTSGLLDQIAKDIASFIQDNSLSLWTTLVIFASLILVCTTFVSHTVGAIVVIPIVQAIGSQMKPVSHAYELVFAAALACSTAMGLPVSGFPNMNAIIVEDSLGNRFLTTNDFIKYALPASISSLGVLVTLGYWLIIWSEKLP